MTETAPVTTKKRLTELMAERYHMKAADVVTMMMGTALKTKKGDAPPTEAEQMAFMGIAYEYGLNPIAKEIYGFRAQDGSLQPIVGIDGWVKLATKHAHYGGHRTTMALQDSDGKLATMEQDLETGIPTMDKVDQDFNWKTAAPIWAQTSFFNTKLNKWIMGDIQLMSECFRPTQPWKQMPSRMLSHKSFSQGSRKAFGFSGIMEADEVERIRSVEAEIVDTKLAGLPQGPDGGTFGVEDDAPRGTVDVLPPSPEDPPAAEEPPEAPEATEPVTAVETGKSGDGESLPPETAPETPSESTEEPEAQAELFAGDNQDALCKDPKSMTPQQRGSVYAAAQKLTKARRLKQPDAANVGKPELDWMLKNELNQQDATMATLSEYQADQMIKLVEMTIEAEAAQS